MQVTTKDARGETLSSSSDTNLDGELPARFVELDESGISRLRMLGWLGAAFAGLGLKLAAPEVAQGAHGQPLFPPCAGLGFTNCHCCNGGFCCEGGCSRVVVGCPGGASCWTGCHSGNRYWCCDHYSSQQGRYCICRVISCANCC